MKRRTRKQWYEYHQASSRDAAREPVLERNASELAAARRQIEEIRSKVQIAMQARPWSSRIAGLFGLKTEYESRVLVPLRSAIAQADIRLKATLERSQLELRQAEERGIEQYRADHALRKQEAVARAARVIERKRERRIQYLERSQAIRSAARFLKLLLIGQQANEEAFVTCFYCGISIEAGLSHLEHK